MAIRPTAVLPKGLITALRRQAPTIRVSPLLTELAATATPAVLRSSALSLDGLTEEEAETRLEQYGYNVVAEAEHHSRLKLLVEAIINPLVILLAALAIISVLTGDVGSAVVMLVMIVLGVGLRFWQEAKADDAAAALKAMISVTATVVRNGQPREVPLAQVVPGDVVKLAAGDMIPADLRLLVVQGLVLDSGQPDGRIVSGREIRGRRSRPITLPGAGTEEHLLSRHERRKRLGARAS